MYLSILAITAALLLMVIAAGTIYYVTDTVTVELRVDGRPEAIKTRADSVAELLSAQGITLVPDDFVAPAADAELEDGTAVEVRFSRELTVEIDGVETTGSTRALLIGDALTELGIPIDGAAVSPPLNNGVPRTGARVRVVTAKPVTLVVGGVPQPVTSNAETVGDLLAAENVVVGANDTLVPPSGTSVTPGMTVTVNRIRIETEVRSEPIPHQTKRTDDGDLTVGTTKVTTDGVDGESEVTYQMIYTNGELTSETVESSTVVKEPVTELVRVGTKPAPAVDPGVSPGGEAAGLNWGALAQCESSGNPKAVNPAGYYGLYQFSLPTWRSVGGTGNPVDASVEEQTMRAQILYNKAGVGQWPHCGPRLYD